MTLSQIITDAQIELDDITHGQSFTEDELIVFCNDQYREWCIFTKCITKVAVNQAWFAGPYFDFVAAFPDAVGVYTILNHQTNRYLFDYTSRTNMDKERVDWELWNGTPTYWFPVSHNRIAVAPNYFPSPVGLYDITYFATPLDLTSGDTPLFASDRHYALVDGTVQRALESVEEFKKAITRKQIFDGMKEKYRKQVASNHSTEMRRIMGG